MKLSVCMLLVTIVVMATLIDDSEGQAGADALPLWSCDDRDGLYPDPEDCGRYYQCSPGQPTFHMSCPDGLHFDPDLLACNWPTSLATPCSSVPEQTVASEGFNVWAQSWAMEDPYSSTNRRTYIISNGQENRIEDGSQRGHQVFILNERTGAVVQKTAFDTQEQPNGTTTAAQNLETFLQGVAEGRIIVIVVYDSGDNQPDLGPYGSTISDLGLRESYAMITQKGRTPYWFVEKKSALGSGPTVVEAFIPTG
ncbi:Cytochrome P450 4f11 [Branchiostoma belcheri]|nr:Cytochrome P450 4f11 [Branchiostoma belcheri]